MFVCLKWFSNAKKKPLSTLFLSTNVRNVIQIALTWLFFRKNYKNRSAAVRCRQILVLGWSPPLYLILSLPKYWFRACVHARAEEQQGNRAETILHIFPRVSQAFLFSANLNFRSKLRLLDRWKQFSFSSKIWGNQISEIRFVYLLLLMITARHLSLMHIIYASGYFIVRT